LPNREWVRQQNCTPQSRRERVSALEKTSQEIPQTDNPALIREHLANERTFLAWVRTGMAVVIFGFAIGRFAIAIREFTRAAGCPERGAGLSVWFGVFSIGTGIALVFAGFNRYRRNRVQLEAGTFKPAGYIIDLVTIITIALGLALAAYLIYIQEPG
jgi:putative membrane protein